MRDASFRKLLIEEVIVRRPSVELGPEGVPYTPTYADVADSVRVRVMPASAVSEDDLLGRLEEATHVLYVEPFDLRENDRIVVRPAATALTEDVQQGATTLPVKSVGGMLEGAQVEIGVGSVRELRTIVGVGCGELEVAPELQEAHEQDEPVSMVRKYDVLTVSDEAGTGHHLRAVLREIK